MNGQQHRKHLIKDFCIIGISVVIAIVIVKTDIVHDVFAATKEMKILTSFIAGIFFISAFTAVPAGVVLYELAKNNSVLTVAFFGALGGVVGDFIIFRFIKDSLGEDLKFLLKKVRSKRVKLVFKLKLFRWLTPLLGALIIASPLPDELGIALLGFSKMKTAYFIPLSFILDFSGIFIIALIAKYIA